MTSWTDINRYDVRKSLSNTRLEVVADLDSESKLTRQYENAGVEIVDVADIHPSSGRLLDPVALLNVAEEYNPAIVKVIRGFSQYLSMWNPEPVRNFYYRVATLLENQKSNLILIVGFDNYEEGPFRNPKYVESGQLVFLKSNDPAPLERTSHREIVIADSDQAPGDCAVADCKELLKKICRNDRERAIFAMSDRGLRPNGLNKSVIWPTDYSSALSLVWGVDHKFSEETSKVLIQSCNSSHMQPMAVVEESFGKENLDPKLVLKTLIEHQSDPLFKAYLYYVQCNEPIDSYIHHAVSTYDSKEPFGYHYVVTAALAALGNSRFANERREAIGRVSDNNTENWIQRFIEKSKDDLRSTVWLNCGTKFEKIELIRRLFGTDLSAGIPSSISKLYPNLGMYLGLDYDYAYPVLTDYFKKYRINKLSNTIPPDFIEVVNSMKCPNSIPSRRTRLVEYSLAPNVALMVVDGLGAEYLPFIVSLLRECSINVERADVVTAELPTSTRFNAVEWPSSRMLPDVKDLDNTAHDGACRHEDSTVEENIHASLTAIQDKVIRQIIRFLNDYDKIIVTADHGLTRLAVLARECGLSKTIAVEGIDKIDDWRFTEVPSGKTHVPDGIQPHRRSDSDNSYWIVRNYDRLPKSGGKKYEMHGGAALEELLVPFIVVTKDEVPATSKVEKPENPPQMRERDLGL